MKQYANVHLNDYDSSSCNPGTALLIFLITFKQVKAEISKEECDKEKLKGIREIIWTRNTWFNNP